MSGVNIEYKGESIATIPDTGSKTIKTQGKYCEGDILVEYEAPPTPTLITKQITENGTYTAAEDNTDGYSEVTVVVPVPAPVEEKNLNLWDWNGELAYSYTRDEVMALTSLPSDAGRTHDLLQFQEWNWSLADIKDYFQHRENGVLDVGANYTTTDHQNHTYWDDPILHSDHNVKIIKSKDAMINTQYYDRNALETVNFPVGGTQITNRLCNLCYSLKFAVLPNGIVNCKGGNNFDSVYSVKVLSLPKTLTQINSGSFLYRAIALKRIAIPEVAVLGANVFYGCYNLERIELNNVSEIGANAFVQCYSLARICLKSKPVLGGTFGAPNAIIYVPRANLSWFETATNWSAVYPQMVAIEDNIALLKQLGFDVHEYE